MAEIYPEIVLDAYLNDFLYDLDGNEIIDVDDANVVIYGNEWVDISADIKKTVRHDRGIKRWHPTTRLASTGNAYFQLKNDVSNTGGLLGYYSPGNTNCRQGWQEDIKVRIGYSHPDYNGGTAVYRWYGRIDSIEPSYGQYSDRIVTVKCFDYMAELNTNTKATQVAIQTDVTSDEAYAAIIATMPRQPEGTDFAAGVDILPYVMHRSGEGSGACFQEMARVALSDFSYVFIDKDGQVVSQSRHTRALDRTVQFTITGAQIQGMKAVRDRKTAPDRITTRIYPVNIGTSDEVCYTLQNTIRLSPGESYTLEAKYTDPTNQKNVGLTSPVTLAADTHYKFGPTDDGASNGMNDALTIVSQNFYSGELSVEFRNDGTRVGFINMFKPQGRLIRFNDPIIATLEIDSTGNNTITVDMPYQDNPVFASQIRELIADVYSAVDRVESVDINLNDATWFANYMDTDTGKRIALTETVTGQNADEYFLNSEAVEYKPGKIMNVSYMLAPSIVSTPFIFGVTNWGEAYWTAGEG